MNEIKTPETHPDHPVVGRDILAHDGHRYFCDSYDPRIGFWMTRLDCPPENLVDQNSEFRRNVSERAIGRTFYVIHVDHYDGRTREHAAIRGAMPSRLPGQVGEAVYNAKFERDWGDIVRREQGA